MLPYVVKVDLKRKRPNWTLYIGRAWSGFEKSKWHNPFHLYDRNMLTRRSVVLQEYEYYLRNNKELMASIPELSDQILGCWCYPEACHGDVLVKVYKEICRPGIGDMSQAVDMHGNLVLVEPKLIVEEHSNSEGSREKFGWVRFEGQLGYWPKSQVVWP